MIEKNIYWQCCCQKKAVTSCKRSYAISIKSVSRNFDFIPRATFWAVALRNKIFILAKFSAKQVL